MKVFNNSSKCQLDKIIYLGCWLWLLDRSRESAKNYRRLFKNLLYFSRYNKFLYLRTKMSDICICFSCLVDTARFLKYVWTFFNIMHESVNDFECI